ncbi:556_t:CDS:2 [Dentiscutata erythropus]|uniref:556_t:CDS:1 n=1 Tax=Dentiscutata erythropus TaxID=1348616 RepID=A0A9N9NFJ7_9GLOM|nr:556_t:CDS:2 [Dentiscutata erythropus]
MVIDYVSATTATYGTTSLHGYGLCLCCWLQLFMELRLCMVMDYVSALESKKKGHIDNFWLKSLLGLKRNLTENDKINTKNIFVSCDLDGIQIGNNKALNEFQLLSKRVKNDKPEQQQTSETSGKTESKLPSNSEISSSSEELDEIEDKNEKVEFDINIIMNQLEMQPTVKLQQPIIPLSISSALLEASKKHVVGEDSYIHPERSEL